jgi:hypothetical protein
MRARLSAQEPKKEIYEFAGNFKELKEVSHNISYLCDMYIM